MAKAKFTPVFTAGSAGVLGPGSFRVSWVDADGNRRHVWTNNARDHVSGTIYVNPPEGTQHRGPGYFSTRQLKLEAAVNLPVKAAIEADLPRLKLEAIAEGEAEKARDEARRQQEWQDRFAAQMDDIAPTLGQWVRERFAAGETVPDVKAQLARAIDAVISAK